MERVVRITSKYKPNRVLVTVELRDGRTLQRVYMTAGRTNRALNHYVNKALNQVFNACRAEARFMSPITY